MSSSSLWLEEESVSFRAGEGLEKAFSSVTGMNRCTRRPYVATFLVLDEEYMMMSDKRRRTVRPIMGANTVGFVPSILWVLSDLEG